MSLARNEKRAVPMKTFLSNLVWQIDIPKSLREINNSVHVDLGSGLTPRNPFGAQRLIATDIGIKDFQTIHYLSGEPEVEYLDSFDLTTSFSFESNSISSFSAYDVVEHIPRWERFDGIIRFPFVHFMNEIHRCLVPGGFFLAVTPFFPRDASFVDPTHVNYVSIETIDYFCNDQLVKSLTSCYGFEGIFEKICSTKLRGPGPFLHGHQTLRSVRGRSSFPIFLMKLSKRVFNLPRVNKATHLLWVMRKPL